MNVKWKYRISGAAAGLVSGLFGGGGACACGGLRRLS